MANTQVGPVYKVINGSTISFLSDGPKYYAILANTNGSIIKGTPSLSTPYEVLAEEILISTNNVDSNGAPLSFTVETRDPDVIDNAIFEINRVSLTEAPDQTALNIAKVNSDIATENSKNIKSTVNSTLPPKVRLVNLINNNRTKIQKQLIPIIIKLLMPFGGEIVQAILNKLPLDQIKQLVKCPSQTVITKLIKQRNSLAKQINSIYNIVKTTTITITGVNVLLSILEIAVTVAKAIPYPATGVPPLGLPPLTAGVQNTLSDALRITQEQIKSTKKVLNIVTIALASFGVLLGIILRLLEALDKLLQQCAQETNMDFETINDEINSLANSTIQTSQNPSNNNSNTYRGFKLEVVVNEKNESSFIQRYAQALNVQGVPVLKTDPSFASDPQVLINQLKFIIDSNPNLTAE